MVMIGDEKWDFEMDGFIFDGDINDNELFVAIANTDLSFITSIN